MINLTNFGRPQSYYMAGTPVAPATAVNPATAGQAFGGQGMALPPGATTVAPAGANWGGGVTSMIGGLTDAASQYAAADALKAKVPFQLSTKLATFETPQLDPRKAIQA